jgi:hypothetical protein
MPARRDSLFAAASLAAAAAVLAIGFHFLGPRDKQRALEDLQSIARLIRAQHPRDPAVAPAELPHGPGVNLNDPATGARYEYHPKSGTAYELCATFATDSATDSADEGNGFRAGYSFWSHPAGHHCYQLDASGFY